VGDFKAQDLANTAWAFSAVGCSDTQLFMTLVRVTEQNVGDFTAQNLTNAAWSFAMVGRSDALLFLVLASMV